ncbi:MAG TPA: hypothetical protein VI461_18520 [Chitinophagaceae bacterium]|nr:hypothetical protein [Chitinophagaceae bacterium]
MAAPFRIVPPTRDRAEGTTFDAEFREYLSRLLKMIPGEIVGLYMIGNGIIPSTNSIFQFIWIVICTILIVVIRIYGTSDQEEKLPAQPVPVAIATIAFVIWVYWLGGPFITYKLHVSWLSSILVLLWSFIIPYFYKGPKPKLPNP